MFVSTFFVLFLKIFLSYLIQINFKHISLTSNFVPNRYYHFEPESIYLPTPTSGQDVTQGQYWSGIGLNSEFSFCETCCLTKPKELILPYYLLIARGRMIGFIHFPGVLLLWNQIQPVFEPVTMCPFPTLISNTQRYLSFVCNSARAGCDTRSIFNGF